MNDRLAKLEHVDSFLDFDSELASLIISLVPLFASHSVSNMDIQREFESAAHDEGLLNEEENEEENETNENINKIKRNNFKENWNCS